MKRNSMWYVVLTVIAMLLTSQTGSFAYDITDKFSIGSIMAGTYQYQWVDGDENKGRGAFNFEPQISFRPNEQNELFAKFGFGAGNGLNGETNFNLAPWAANLEDDYTDINGRNRDYLLTAWYKYRFNFGENHSLGLTAASSMPRIMSTKMRTPMMSLPSS